MLFLIQSRILCKHAVFNTVKSIIQSVRSVKTKLNLKMKCFIRYFLNWMKLILIFKKLKKSINTLITNLHAKQSAVAERTPTNHAVNFTAKFLL